MLTRLSRGFILCLLQGSVSCGHKQNEAPPRAEDANLSATQHSGAKPRAEIVDNSAQPQFMRMDDLTQEPGSQEVRIADGLIARALTAKALAQLEGTQGAAAALLRARALLGSVTLSDIQYSSIERALKTAENANDLQELVALERARFAQHQNKTAQAINYLMPLFQHQDVQAIRAGSLLTQLLKGAQLLKHQQRLEELLNAKDPQARGQLLAALQEASLSQDMKDAALELGVQLYIEEPLSKASPESPPRTLSNSEALRRGLKILKLNRNTLAIQELERIEEKGLSPAEMCTRRFGLGLAHRKQHHYTTAETHLGWVMAKCEDQDLVRRAHYLRAKVVSIKSGLRSIPLVDSFAKNFQGHTMVDDVLFWAGDLYQRRGRYADAERYYQRIVNLRDGGDHCGDARWRMAWMKQGNVEQFIKRLNEALKDTACGDQTFDRARLRYWLGRSEQKRGKRAAALTAFEQVLEEAPLTFYAQLAMKRLLELAPEKKNALRADWTLPKGQGVPPLCLGHLSKDPQFAQALTYLKRGLNTDAAETLRALVPAEKKVVGKSHAVNQGIATKEKPKTTGAPPQPGPTAEPPEKGHGPAACAPHDADLLIILLLDRAGAQREAHWRLRSEFSETLSHFPTSATIGIFRAAYPLAYRDALEAAEKEQGLPSMMLQALAREESAFDANVVSWAAAYGLTQLLMRTGKAAGKLLRPALTITTEAELLDPVLNARLGGAFLNSLLKRYGNFFALALVAYNASDSFATTLWRRHADHDFERFAEEITIRETRGYVKRVLKSYGIYRWLYGVDELLMLPISLRLPRLNAHD